MAKTQSKNEDVQVSSTAAVKQVIRTISYTGMQSEGDLVTDIDDYLSEFLLKGYKLLSTHVIKQIEDTNPEMKGRILGVSVLYVLVRE